MRRELDELIDEARRAEGPTAMAQASAREALARRIARGDQVELEPEPPEVATGSGLGAPGLARGGWALLGAAAVAAALLVDRPSPSSIRPLDVRGVEDGTAAEVPRAAPSLPRVDSEPRGVVSELPPEPELAQPEPSDGVSAPDRALQPLPEPPSGTAPSRAARRRAPPTSAEAPGPAPSSPGAPSSSDALQPEAGEPAVHSLAAESRALAEVQGALRDGEHDRALWLLGEHDRKFARGVLLEERAAARAIASCGAGLGDAARDSARAFASRYPNSPLRARVRASCEDLEPERPEPGP